MNDTERMAQLEARIAQLETELADVKRRLTGHEGLRSGAIDGLLAVQRSIEHLQRRITPLPPEVEMSRQTSWLEQAAIIKTRLRADEEAYEELRAVIVELFTMTKEVMELLKPGAE
jgi:hypothetical protein